MTILKGEARKAAQPLAIAAAQEAQWIAVAHRPMTSCYRGETSDGAWKFVLTRMRLVDPYFGKPVDHWTWRGYALHVTSDLDTVNVPLSVGNANKIGKLALSRLEEKGATR